MLFWGRSPRGNEAMNEAGFGRDHRAAAWLRATLNGWQRGFDPGTLRFEPRRQLERFAEPFRRAHQWQTPVNRSQFRTECRPARDSRWSGNRPGPSSARCCSPDRRFPPAIRFAERHRACERRCDEWCRRPRVPPERRERRPDQWCGRAVLKCECVGSYRKRLCSGPVRRKPMVSVSNSAVCSNPVSDSVAP